MRALVVLIWIWVAASAGSATAATGWRELDGVRFDGERYSDGDSFHAERKNRTYIFRLYFVDTPETDQRYPDRLKAQAAYFGVTVEQVVAGGGEAAAFVKELLKDKTFEVHTRYENARGSSDRKRYFAMVKVGDRWLSELLVERGVARIYGFNRELPDGTSARAHLSRLRKLEKEAKEAHRGLWGVASGKRSIEDLKTGTTVALSRRTPVFHRKAPHGLVGHLPKGWTVTVGAKTRTGFREVSFTSPGGADFTGEVQERSLR